MPQLLAEDTTTTKIVALKSTNDALNVNVVSGGGSGGGSSTGGPVSSYVEAAATIGTTSSTAAPANTSRKALFIKNESTTASIAVRFGASAAALNTAGSITLGPGESISITDSVTLQAVQAIASAASTPVTILQAQ